MKQTLYVLRGLPASGKSTWSLNKAKDDPNIVIVSRDGIRRMLAGEYDKTPFIPRLEDLVTLIENISIKYALIHGHDVIIDSTGFRWGDPETKFYEMYYNCKVEFVNFNHVPLEVCIERDKNRDNSVGEDTIRKMYDKYLK